jgi:hypothetical protein
MLTLWSEVPSARACELAADLGTMVWVAVWAMVSRRLYDMLAAFAGAGRILGDGGRHVTAAGEQIGTRLGGIPVIGSNVGQFVSSAFARAAEPFLLIGTYFEHLLLVVAILFSVIVLLTALALWFHWYIPWRWARVTTLQAAHRVIRETAQASTMEVERLLASRALHRLSYQELLKYSPDPFGDWARGHYERLAQAELASVGLQRRDAGAGGAASRFLGGSLPRQIAEPS